MHDDAETNQMTPVDWDDEREYAVNRIVPFAMLSDKPAFDAALAEAHGEVLDVLNAYVGSDRWEYANTEPEYVVQIRVSRRIKRKGVADGGGKTQHA